MNYSKPTVLERLLVSSELCWVFFHWNLQMQHKSVKCFSQFKSVGVVCFFLFSLPEKSSVENDNCFQCRGKKRKSALQPAVLKWPDNMREISTRLSQTRSWMTRSLRSCTQLQADRAWGPLQPPRCSLQLGTAGPTATCGSSAPWGNPSLLRGI